MLIFSLAVYINLQVQLNNLSTLSVKLLIVKLFQILCQTCTAL